MSAATHTPGPWKARAQRLLRSVAITAAGGKTVAVTTGSELHPVHLANARVMAAAPEMAEALHAWKQWHAGRTTALYRKAQQMTDIALAKAGVP